MNRTIISFRYYAVTNKINNSKDLMHNTADFRQEEKAFSCVEISKMEALEKLIGLVHRKHRCKLLE